MSREIEQMTRERLQLLEELAAAVRAGQRATDVVDDVVCQLLGINRSDARCLDILEERGRMSAGDLAEASRLTTGAITAVIDRLERAGYARRVPDPSDRRRVLVELTPAALKTSMELMGTPMTELGLPHMSRYTDDELRLLIDFSRFGSDLQERHAEWLRARLRERGQSAPGQSGPGQSGPG
jgi:DNA-binding MarR family transcriptional regulator